MTQVQATRDRIVDAAIDLYAELGISGTTLRQIAMRADVAPGTLRNHFATRDELDRAMIERVQADAPLPDVSIFDGAESLMERASRLLRVSGSFIDQTLRLQQMWARERLLTPAWIEAGAAYGARWEELFRVALGPLADDPEAMAIVRAVLEPSFHERVRAGTRTTDQASDLIAAVISPWLAARHNETAAR